MDVLVGPTPATRQVSGSDPGGRPVLAVLVKFTYRLSGDGRLSPHEKPLPLREELRGDEKNPALLAHDSDLYPWKPLTDVVVQGHAYAPSGQKSFPAGVAVGNEVKSILVLGDRTCGRSSTGKALFSEPAAVEKVPLRYDRAYGGRDAVAERKHGNPLAELAKYLDPRLSADGSSPYLYPRNPAGVGYLVEAAPEAVEGLRLPNLEDPQDRLTPERIAAGGTGRWPLQPLPAGFDWMDPGWFPRIAYVGLVPPHDPPERPLAETARGFAPAGLLDAKPVAEKVDFRAANGASLGLQLPALRGDEECILLNLHRDAPRLAFRLPGRRPKIWTDGRDGKFNKAEVVLHTLLVEPDESRVSLLWRGSAPARRPYLPPELEKMPYRVEG
jgi:hypothetical protein